MGFYKITKVFFGYVYWMLLSCFVEDLTVKKSLKVVGNPRINNNDNGAPQLAVLSTNPHIASPEMGLIKAVENAQITAQIITIRIG